MTYQNVRRREIYRTVYHVSGSEAAFPSSEADSVLMHFLCVVFVRTNQRLPRRVLCEENAVFDGVREPDVLWRWNQRCFIQKKMLF